MTITQKRVLAALLLIGLIYFGAFLWPNAQGSKDPDMVSIFEPDEGVQYGHPIRMLSPSDSLKDMVRKFVFYQHYYYGFPFYVASVALALLPIKLVAGLENTALNMLWLRQMVSVLPMILSVLVLVFIQTRYKKWLSSLALFIFLLTIPAVFENSTWWHPDSLTLLFIVLTFFFLDRDDLRFGPNFYLAGFTCGLATATKLLGLFFFLAIPIYLLIGLQRKRLSLRTAALKAVVFVLIMGATFVLANPFLLNGPNRQFALDIQIKQAKAMSSGWNVLYDGGPLAWYPMIRENYGNIATILLAFCVLGLSIWRNHRRVLNILIAAWVIPYLAYVLLEIVIKPHHFLIPAFLPLFSCLAAVFVVIPAPKLNSRTPAAVRSQLPNLAWAVVVTVILGYQFVFNLAQDVEHYRSTLNKEKESQEIQFYEGLKANYLGKIPENTHLNIFRDVRTYFPRSQKRVVIARSRPATYKQIWATETDLVLVWNQRALDYTAPDTLEKAIDKVLMQQVYDFYQDVRQGDLDGFSLLYKTECCSAYLRDKLYQEYFR
jgi:hypothetical protein